VATLFAAPSAAAQLGEFGADVIKIEQPGSGDHQRRFGSTKNGVALMWKSVSRNKRSVTLDLRKPRGAEIFKQLVQTADVLIENFRVGTLERWGLGPDVLLELNPRLIVLRITGYGQTGPYRLRPGFGTLAEAMSGFSHLVGEPDGPPTLPSFPLADAVAGTHAAFAIMVALFARERGACGQVIDISLLEPMLRLMEPFLLDYDQLGLAKMRPGNRSSHVAPRNAYRCADGGWVAMSASAQPIFERLAVAIGRPDLVADPRFATPGERLKHADELETELVGWFEQKSSADVLSIMESAEVALGPVYDVPAIFADEHMLARESLIRVDDPDLGSVRLVNVVPRMSETPGTIRTTGPRLGEHTGAVLAELGIGDEDLRQLKADGVI
jgi:crotonobetainyl-CoA:carnitine CoA-transferase CaiB-like acyl-CoA transferase